MNTSFSIFIFLCAMVAGSQPYCLNYKHRPQIHFSPAKYWMNDPNGLVYLDGEYHLFFQYAPNSTTPAWGSIHWGHAISTDLLHWEEFPIALYPDRLGQAFSGSAIVDYHNTTGLQTGDIAPIIAIFTQADEVLGQQQSLAVSNDKGRTFQKYSGNAVLSAVNKPDFRDPKVIEVNGKWTMSLAVNNKIEFYSSSDLKNWTSLSEFGSSPKDGSHAGVWECPDLFSLNINGLKIWVLLVSINPGGPNLGSATQYFLGDFNGTHFRKFGIDQLLWMDWGPDNYAGVTFSNEPQNRKLMIGWMNNWIYGDTLPTEAWRGQMTLPRVFELKRVDGGKLRLASTPAKEVELLRNLQQFYQITQPLSIKSENVYDLTKEMNFRNPLLEIDVVFDTTLITLDPSASFQMCFFNGYSEEVCVGYKYSKNEIYLDRQRSGETKFNSNFDRVATAKRETKSKIIQAKIFLDTSAIELFLDGGVTSMTALFFPTEPFFGINIAFSSKNAANTLIVRSVTVRGLKTIYNC